VVEEVEAKPHAEVATRLVTLQTFEFLPEAELAREFLAEEGFTPLLTDAEVVAMNWLLGNAVGYIKLQVPTDQAAEARDSLLRHRHARGKEQYAATAIGDGSGHGSRLSETADAHEPHGVVTDLAGEGGREIEPEAEGEEEDNAADETYLLENFRQLKRPVIWFLLSGPILAFGALIVLLIAGIVWLVQSLFP
jgi:hypothetical protein